MFETILPLIVENVRRCIAFPCIATGGYGYPAIPETLFPHNFIRKDKSS